VVLLKRNLPTAFPLGKEKLGELAKNGQINLVDDVERNIKIKDPEGVAAK
jgi:hypothetical protein